jgi:hypothetical protein
MFSSDGVHDVRCPINKKFDFKFSTLKHGGGIMEKKRHDDIPTVMLPHSRNKIPCSWFFQNNLTIQNTLSSSIKTGLPQRNYTF